MTIPNAEGKVTATFHLCFTGLTHNGLPNFYHLEGKGWKPGGKEVNPYGLPDGWRVLDVSTTIELQVPADFNPVAQAIAGIDDEIQSVRAEAELKVQSLVQKRNDLLMLGHEATKTTFEDIPF